MSDTPKATTPVIVYSAPWCSFCKMAKAYLHSKNVPFKDIDIEQEPAAAQHIVQATGQAGIPVIEIGDSFILGFDRPAIDQALQSHKLI